MSLRKPKHWIVRALRADMEQSPAVREIAQRLGVAMPTAQLLINRGCTDTESARRFLSKETEHMHDPFLMRDMNRAVARIRAAVEGGERIVIYGDYDVDGVTSVSILYLYLKGRGADVSYYIPCRNGEGYGVSMAAVKRLAEGGASLIITVDTGITAVEEAAYAKSLGIELVITDHHECHGTLPAAEAIVNPRRADCPYPFKELAGVGVVFKLLCALESAFCPEEPMIGCVRRISRDYCDLVAVGTVADVMPVSDENRLIISYGLSLIENSSRPGLIELIEATKSDSKFNGKRKITASFIGYTIAPRINAAGRIRDASLAVELFLAPDLQTAAPIARELCEINRERQAEENSISEEAYAQIEATHDFAAHPVVVLENEAWHHGIIGIVSSRITEKFGTPSVLISFEGQGDLGKGSGRSVKGMNLVEALASCADLLEKFGGHELAAGLTIKREHLPEFKRRINEYAADCFKDTDMTVSMEADCELLPEDITMALASELYCLEPFGVSNPAPVFVIYGVTVADITPVGGGKHTRITARIGGVNVTVMFFRRTAEELDLYAGDCVDIMFGLDINEFMNQKSVQMVAKDVRLTASIYEAERRELALYDVLSGGELRLSNPAEAAYLTRCPLPERQDFAVVYSTLKRELRAEHEVFSLRSLRHLLAGNGVAISLLKLKTVITVLGETGLLRVETPDAEREIYAFGYIRVNEKIDLEQSPLLQTMRYNYSRILSQRNDSNE